MYTQALFGLVIIAHGIYVIGNWLEQTDWKLSQLSKPLTSYLTATLAGLAAFVPWGYIMIANASTASRHLSWSTREVSPFYLIGMWGYNFSAIFLDTNHSIKFVDQFDFRVLLSYSIRVLILIMAVYSIYFLYSKTKKRSWLFIHAMIVTSFLGLALPDLLGGGMRSGGGYRYLTPSFLAIQISVAYLLAAKMSCSSRMRRTTWQGVTAFVIGCGIVSCAVSSQAETWWSKPISYYHPRVARMVNQAHHPLLIMGGAGKILSLSHLLDPKVMVWLVTNSDRVQIPKGFSDVFVFDPSLSLREKLESNDKYTMKEIDPRSRLWRLEELHLPPKKAVADLMTHP
jgi:uncharacterized membrane protein